MMINIENLRDALIGVAVGIAIATALLLLEAPAHAQAPRIPITSVLVPMPSGSGAPVDDVATNVNTDITATSVTTGGGAGAYAPNAQYISSLDQTLFSGVNSQNFGETFPGWVPLPPNSTELGQALTEVTLRTYASALATAQAQANELAGESASGIEQVSGSTTNLLTAVQANTEAVLAVYQELQLERQLQVTLITVIATDAAERLNERAQTAATNAKLNLGGSPQ